MTAETWRDAPLDVDGVLTLSDHMKACQWGRDWSFGCGDEDAVVRAESEV